MILAYQTKRDEDLRKREEEEREARHQSEARDGDVHVTPVAKRHSAHEVHAEDVEAEAEAVDDGAELPDLEDVADGADERPCDDDAVERLGANVRPLTQKRDARDADARRKPPQRVHGAACQGDRPWP